MFCNNRCSERRTTWNLFTTEWIWAQLECSYYEYIHSFVQFYGMLEKNHAVKLQQICSCGLGLFEVLFWNRISEVENLFFKKTGRHCQFRCSCLFNRELKKCKQKYLKYLWSVKPKHPKSYNGNVWKGAYHLTYAWFKNRDCLSQMFWFKMYLVADGLLSQGQTEILKSYAERWLSYFSKKIGNQTKKKWECGK